MSTGRDETGKVGGVDRSLGARAKRLVVAFAAVYMVMLAPVPLWARILSGVVLVLLVFRVGRVKRAGRPSWPDRYLRPRVLHGKDHDPEYVRAALSDPEMRYVAAGAVADLGDTEAIPDLMRLLRAADPHVRVAAVKALGKLHADEAIPRLRELAEGDEVSWVRTWAADTLVDLGYTEVKPILLDLLREDRWIDRSFAVYSLGVLGDPTTLAAVSEARRRDRWHWRYLLMRGQYREAVKRLRRASLEQDGR